MGSISAYDVRRIMGLLRGVQSHADYLVSENRAAILGKAIVEDVNIIYDILERAAIGPVTVEGGIEHV
jgi:hypothetical protein